MKSRSNRDLFVARERNAPLFFALRSELRRAGFTLVELMVVVALMAVFASLSLPAMSRTARGTSLKASGDRLAELIRFGYASAVSHKRPTVVNIHAETRKCWVSMAETSLPWLETDREETSRILAAMTLPGEVEILVDRPDPTSSAAASGEAWEAIPFASDGRTDDVLIELRDRDGDRFTIMVSGEIGQVDAEYERNGGES